MMPRVVLKKKGNRGSEVNKERYELNVKYMMNLSCFDTVRLLPFIARYIAI